MLLTPSNSQDRQTLSQCSLILEAPQFYNVQVVNANPTLGTVSPEGVQQVESGSSIRLTATPKGEGKSFVGWKVNNKIVSTNETFDYVPAGNGTIAGTFCR